MRLLFIRHGDPDYKNDTLTEKGKIEAAALADFIDFWKIDEAYKSPLGRASLTAKYSLDAMNKEAITYDWLREFNADIDVNIHPEWLKAYPDTERTADDTKYTSRICWDMVPAYLNDNPIYYDSINWRKGDICTKSDLLEKYDNVCKSFDELLAGYGYERDGSCYKVTRENDVTIAFFCHFGVICVILSHLLNMSPFTLWNGICLAPTSVTEVVTEEREKGCAQYRILKSGDVTHLFVKGVEPSFSARFAELYSNEDERH